MPPRARAALAYVAVFAAAGAFVPYIPLYYRSIGFTLAEVGWILALGSLVGLLASPAWGALSDRFHGRPVVLLGAALLGLAGVAILALAREPALVALGGAIFGAGAGGVSPIVDARALESAGASRSGYGPLRAWGSVSYIVSALGTGALVERAGPWALFFVLIPALVATGAVGLALRPAAAERKLETVARPLREAGRLFGPSGLGAFLVGAFLSWLGMSAVLNFTPIRFEELGAGATIVGLGGAIAAAIEVPVMLGFPRLAARFGTNRLVIAGAALLAARSVVATAAGDPVLLLAASIFGGLGFALFFVGGVTYVSTHVPPQLAATAQGVFQGVGNSLSQVAASAAGGAIAGALGIAGLFAISAGVGVVGTLIVALAVGSRTSPRSAPARISGPLS